MLIYQHEPVILLEEWCELLKVQGRRRLVDVSVREAKMKFWCILLKKKCHQEYLETGSPSESPYASTTCSTFPILPSAPEIYFHMCSFGTIFQVNMEAICCNILLSADNLLRSICYNLFQSSTKHNLLRPGMRLRTWGSWESSTPAIERKFPNQEVEATFVMWGSSRH